MADFDSPWKEALESYFPAFLALFFPSIHTDIDWSCSYVFLDKELQRIMPKGGRGRQYVDKLVKVWRKDGGEAWVLIHIEVQTQREAAFPQRMYAYNTRLADKYNRTVVSLAVMADDDPDWRPDHFQADLWGWSVRMSWPPVKLLDYADRVAELEQSKNLFAPVLLAHLKALETQHDADGRRTWKFRLARGLFERGFKKQDVRQLLRVIDWLMDLRRPPQQQFEQELGEYEEGRKMPYVTSFEREGMFKMIEAALRMKFGEAAMELAEVIHDLNDAEKYLTLQETIITANTLEQVRRAYSKVTAPTGQRKKNGNRKRGSSKT